MKKGNLYINGEWVESKAAFTSISPLTGEQFGTIGLADKAEVQSAVSAAKNALVEWRAMGVTKRCEILKKVVGLLIEAYGNQGEPTELKLMICNETGKRLPEADIEVIESSDMLAFFADKAVGLLQPRPIKLNGELWPTKESKLLFEPVGVVGIIKAWNYPLEVPIWAIAPALAAGNTVVFKPSEHSPFVGIEITKIFERAGIPPGVFNLITGDGNTGSALVDSDGIDMISFTGGQNTGTEIAVKCAKKHIKCCLELSGNDAAIVDSDVDPELAANGLVWGAFCNSGQVCTGIKMVFMNQITADRLVPLIVEKTNSLRKNIDYGPIISKKQVESIEEFINDAVSKGAQLLTGGKRAGAEGYYYYPTVLLNVNKTMKIMQEECFGIVLPICVVDEIKEAIDFINSSEYGLGASVWTKDVKKGEKIAQEIQTGMIWVNDVNVAFPEAPWGGIRKSGYGVDLSEWGLYEYVNRKHINIETSSDVSRIWWYPYQIN